MKPVIIAIIIVFLVVAIGALIVTPEKEIVSDIDEPNITPIPEQEETSTSTIIEQKELTSNPVESTPSCDSSYPDVCIAPYPPDLDCGEIGYSNFSVIGNDPHGFDKNNDGIGCES